MIACCALATDCGPRIGVLETMAVAVREAALASNWSSQLPRRGALISVSSADCANAGAAIALAPTVAADARKARRERASIPFFFDIVPTTDCGDKEMPRLFAISLRFNADPSPFVVPAHQK